MNIFTDVIIPIFRDTVKQFFPLLPYFVFLVCVCTAAFLTFNHFYKKGTYYKITRNPYLSVRSDLGKYGEYLIYKELRHLENDSGRFLFNVYIPTKDGETSEIDVMLICKYGIFIFESKNYSGWIFGTENQPKWTQTLPRGKGKSQKEHFYNPIMQNKSHINHLKNLIGEDIPIHSVIVFSNRCVLKNVETTSTNIPVINRYNIAATVKEAEYETQTVLTEERVAELYTRLYPFSQTDSTAKAEHIERIKGGKPNNVPVENTQKITVTNDFPTCPRCGSKLVLRTAKRGPNAGKQFYGCSAYPGCRYTRDV